MKELLQEYKKKKKEIKARLQYFSSIYKKPDKDIFQELCFCILTPQAKAVVCDEAIRKLQEMGLLYKGSLREIRPYLKAVRFPNNKAKYLLKARDFFKNGRGLALKSKLDAGDIHKTRDWLVRNVKGIGYKEASHFLRNIGLGKGLAILDRHILKNLKRHGVIKEIPVSLTRKTYIDIENRMRKFFEKVGIPMEEVDLLFWSKETGFIFR